MLYKSKSTRVYDNYSGNPQKNILSAAVGLCLISSINVSSAALPTGTVLTIVPATGSCVAAGTFPDCQYNAVIVDSGSFFNMGGDFAAQLFQDEGVIIDIAQPAGTGSHSGAPLPGDTGAVTEPWSFFSNTGHDYTIGDGVNDNDDGTLSLTDWRVTWNGIPEINMGGDPSQGDTGNANITCTPSPCTDGSAYQLSYSAHVPVGDPSGFGGVQYDLTLEGTVIIPTSISIEIIGGTQQECATTGGSNIIANADITVPDGEIDTILWYLDGDGNPVASGKSVGFFVPLGTPTIEVVLSTIFGDSESDTETIAVKDTIAPDISAAFINSKTGVEITSINSKDKADISIHISDACDPSPTASATTGIPTYDGDTVSARSSKKGSSVELSITGNADNVELTVTAEDASGNMSNDKASLMIIQ